MIMPGFEMMGSYGIALVLATGDYALATLKLKYLPLPDTMLG